MKRFTSIAVLSITLLISGCGASTPGNQPSASTPEASQNQIIVNTSETDDNSNIATLTSKTYSSSDASILNPERGLYYWTDLLTSDFSATRTLGYTLIYARVLLDDYTDKALDDAMLNQISNAFDKVRQAGVKCVLRFVYSDSQVGITDAPLNIILQHINQLKPIINKNSDVIFVMQAGFIGSWGEWHTSTNKLNTNADAQKQILDGILDALPASRHTQVRTPLFKDSYVTLSGSTSPRLGHHNDCFLSSDTDFGTYPSDAIDFWKSYIAKDDHALVGGETCNNNPPRSDCESALQELSLLHYTFLNGSPWGGVIDEWKAQGCYDTINKRLGYRFILQSAEYNDHIRPGEIFHIKLTLQNSGFAPLQYSRNAYLLLKSGDKTYVASLAFDMRTVEPDSVKSVEANITLPLDISEGNYTLSLWMPDPEPTLQDNPLYDIQLANTDGNLITNSITVDANAPAYPAVANTTFLIQ